MMLIRYLPRWVAFDKTTTENNKNTNTMSYLG